MVGQRDLKLQEGCHFHVRFQLRFHLRFWLFFHLCFYLSFQLRFHLGFHVSFQLCCHLRFQLRFHVSFTYSCPESYPCSMVGSQELATVTFTSMGHSQTSSKTFIELSLPLSISERALWHFFIRPKWKWFSQKPTFLPKKLNKEEFCCKMLMETVTYANPGREQ